MSQKKKIKTYAQEHRQAFDWNKFLSKNPGSHTKHERREAEDKASSWVTCACGNQCSIIPREEDTGYDDDPAPLDSKLNRLGVQFYRDIENAHSEYEFEGKNSYAQARKTLRKIEERSAILIRQEHAKLVKKLKDSGFVGFIG